MVFLLKLEDKLREKVTITFIQGVNLKQETKQAEVNAKKINFLGEKEIFSKYDTSLKLKKKRVIS